MLVDYIHHNTYLYASAASGLIPLGRTTVAVSPYVGGKVTHIFFVLTCKGVHEQTIPWPALPPITGNNVQHGPALVVPLPAGCAMVLAGGPFGVNHAVFRLN
jgi:hypothetical protein